MSANQNPKQYERMITPLERLFRRSPYSIVTMVARRNLDRTEPELVWGLCHPRDRDGGDCVALAQHSATLDGQVSHSDGIYLCSQQRDRVALSTSSDWSSGSKPTPSPQQATAVGRSLHAPEPKSICESVIRDILRLRVGPPLAIIGSVIAPD
jgi:hypothetical protein